MADKNNLTEIVLTLNKVVTTSQLIGDGWNNAMYMATGLNPPNMCILSQKIR